VVGSLGVLPFVHQNLLLALTTGLETSSYYAIALAFSNIAFQAIPSALFFSTVHATNFGAGIPRVPVVLKSMLASAIVSILLLPFSLYLLKPAYYFTKPALPLVLAIACVGYLLSSDKKLFESAVVFLVSGLVGWASFSGKSGALFPLLSGLFALPALVFYSKKTKLTLAAKQLQSGFSPREVSIGSVLGWISNFLPAMTPSLVAGALLPVYKNRDSFFCVNSAFISSKLFSDLVFAEEVGKARSAAASAALPDLSSGGTHALFAGVLVAIVSLTFSCAAASFLNNKISSRVERMLEENKTRAAVGLTIFAFVIASSGFTGAVVLAAGFAAGCLPYLMGTRVASCSGALVVPSLLLAAGF
jgi:TctA family transporter